jgi:hypothetical protein
MIFETNEIDCIPLRMQALNTYPIEYYQNMYSK